MGAERPWFMDPIGRHTIIPHGPSESCAWSVAGIDETGREQTRALESQMDVAVGHVFDVDVIAEAAMAVGPAVLVFGGIADLQVAGCIDAGGDAKVAPGLSIDIGQGERIIEVNDAVSEPIVSLSRRSRQ